LPVEGPALIGRQGAQERQQPTSHNVYYVKALAALVAFVCCCGHAAAATMARQMEIGACVIDN
ncbi:hypothetical protein KWH04_24200, partial [Xanthomonas campestris pv. trichodesmae]|nr:hypothetical protein [Xanthomonas campestris pv. trichodesmae]